MDKKAKEKLLNYFYPTEEIRSFMCNDFYQELLNIVPLSLCVNAKNRDKVVREQNYLLAINTIKNFILTDKIYNKAIFEPYQGVEIDNLVEKILESYVFYIVSTNPRHKKIDMYKDSRSICYSNVSIVDML